MTRQSVRSPGLCHLHTPFFDDDDDDDDDDIIIQMNMNKNITNISKKSELPIA